MCWMWNPENCFDKSIYFQIKVRNVSSWIQNWLGYVQAELNIVF